ncbi:Pol, partial [Symbiodinium sp. KB8]
MHCSEIIAQLECFHLMSLMRAVAGSLSLRGSGTLVTCVCTVGCENTRSSAATQATQEAKGLDLEAIREPFWEQLQFVLDPIPLQQIYTKLESRLGELALDVSSKAGGVLPNRRRDGDFAIIPERAGMMRRVTAILEAVLHAIDHSFRRIVIHSDSAWAINCIKGKWRPKRHKALINYTRYLLRLLPFHSLEWIKAHVGHEGNERADALANRGKTQAARQGTSSQYPDSDHTAPAQCSDMISFDQALQSAAKEVFDAKKLSARKPWISEATLEKLSAAKAAEARSDQAARLLFNQAKRSAKKDKVKWIHDQLLADPASNHSTVWQTVRRQKQGFRGRKSHLIVAGKPVPWTKTHEAFRDHLEQKQWAKNPRSDEFAAQLKPRPHLFDPSPDLGPFRLEELQQALSQTATGKAPGPDGIEADLFKLLDHTSEIALLDLYNQARRAGSGPETWTEATVVSIFKGKGADAAPENYRPISLLNASYKIFAAMALAEEAYKKLRRAMDLAQEVRHELEQLRMSLAQISE